MLMTILLAVIVTVLLKVIQGLEKVASVMITWFKLNEMKVNGNKFQLILFNRQMAENVSINVDGYVIKNEHVVCTNT